MDNDIKNRKVVLRPEASEWWGHIAKLTGWNYAEIADRMTDQYLKAFPDLAEGHEPLSPGRVAEIRSK